MRQQISVLLNCLKEGIGNLMQPSFNMQSAQEIYYNNFGDEIDDDERVIPYGNELIDVNKEEVNDSYLKSLDKYINVQVVLPNKEGVPVLDKVKINLASSTSRVEL